MHDQRLELDRDAAAFSGSIAENPTFQCQGWEIRNSTFTDCYQRLLVQGGAGGVLRKNTFRRMGSRVELQSNFSTKNEGGVCRDIQVRDIQVRDNLFEDVAVHPGGIAVIAGFVPLDHKPARGLVTDIVVDRNTFRGYGAHAIVLDGVARGSVTGNTFCGGAANGQPVRLIDCSEVTTDAASDAPPAARRLGPD